MGEYAINVLQNEAGETKYKNINQMHRDDQDKFSKEVLEALKGYDPKAPKPFVLKKQEPKDPDQDFLPF